MPLPAPTMEGNQTQPPSYVYPTGHAPEQDPPSESDANAGQQSNPENEEPST